MRSLDKLARVAPPSTTLRVVPLPRKRGIFAWGTIAPQGFLSRLRGRGTGEAGGAGNPTHQQECVRPEATPC